MNSTRILNSLAILFFVFAPSTALAQKESLIDDAAKNAGTQCKKNHVPLPGSPYMDKLAETYCKQLVRKGIKVLRKSGLRSKGLDLKTNSGQEAFANQASQVLDRDQEFLQTRRQAELGVINKEVIQSIVWGTIGAYMYGDLKAPMLKKSSQASAVTGKQYVVNTNSHVNTGISVNAGDKIKVEASGRIRFGYFVGSGGPKGIFISPEYNYFVDIPHGQLMGRVRQFGAQELDGWFPIGEGREFVARSQGVLEFAVNDNRPGDNAGRFRIEVAIIPAK